MSYLIEFQKIWYFVCSLLPESYEYSVFHVLVMLCIYRLSIPINSWEITETIVIFSVLSEKYLHKQTVWGKRQVFILAVSHKSQREALEINWTIEFITSSLKEEYAYVLKYQRWMVICSSFVVVPTVLAVLHG